MCTHIRPKPYADRKRHLIFYRALQHIGNCQHDVIFLKNLCLPWEKVKIPQIFFGGLKLDDHQLCFRRRPGKIFFRDPISCCYGGKPGTVPVSVD